MTAGPSPEVLGRVDGASWTAGLRGAPVDAARVMARRGAAVGLSVRLAVRAWQVVSPLGAANDPAGRALVGAFAAADIWRAARRPGPAVALAADLIDVAVWAARVGDDGETARIAAVVPAAAALEYGFAAPLLAVPSAAGTAGVLAVVRWLRGHPLRLGHAGWTALLAAPGIGVKWLEARRKRTAADEDDTLMERSRRAAQGQGRVVEVLEGRVRAADGLANVALKLGQITGQDDVAGLGSWESLYTELVAKQSHWYFGNALDRLNAEQRTPDMSARYTLRTDPEGRTAIIAAADLDRLRSAVAALRPTGDVDVAWEDSGRTTLRISADGQAWNMPMAAAAAPDAWTFDALSITGFAAAGLALASSAGGGPRVRRRAAAAAAGWLAFAAASASRRAEPSQRARVGLAAAGALGMAQMIAQTTGRTGGEAPATRTSPALARGRFGVYGYATCLAAAASARRPASTAGGALILLGLAAGLARRVPDSRRSVAAELIWLVPAAAPVVGLQDTIDRLIDGYNKQRASGSRRDVQESTEAGRREVNAFLERQSAVLHSAIGQARADGLISDEDAARLYEDLRSSARAGR